MFACTRKDRLMTRSGSPYLALELRDRTGTLPARAFQNADHAGGRVRARRRRPRPRPGRAVPRRAGAGGDRRSTRATDVDPGHFLPTAYRDLDELDGFLEHLSGEVYDAGYGRLLQSLLADRELRAQWRRAPCTRGAHHSYLGGLLEHTVAVATLAHETCQLHPGVNSDLLICAAIVHDLGRTREFTYGAEIGITDEGRLLGHMAIGARMLTERAAGVLDEPRLLALLHCVLGHHGPSSVPGGRFQSVEALTLFRLNAVDAATKGALEHGLGH